VFAKIVNAVRHAVQGDIGSEVLEWALISGMIVVTAIVAVGAFGGKVLARWTSINSHSF
jgi:Flp pilus assembly pilin Flp